MRYLKRIGIAIFALMFCGQVQAEEGVTTNAVQLGSVLALKGPAMGLGTNMQSGLDAAFRGVQVKGKSIQVAYENDFYEPPKAIEGTNKLVSQKVFAMIGNVGTPTASVTLPLLADAGIPAVGFFTGAGLLRPAPGPVANFRASYVQETAKVIEQAISNGVKPTEICSYVQNDSYGMAGLTGVKLALEAAQAPANLVAALQQIIDMTGDSPERNNITSVGVYRRNTVNVRPGMESLLHYEKQSGAQCKVVVTVGAYGNIAHFARLSRTQGRNWIITAVSFTGADNFRNDLQKYGAANNIMMSQVVPLLDSTLPIVQEAREKLGERFGFVSLEGYIVGKMMIRLLEDSAEPLTRATFMQQVKQAKFDLGGVAIDFTKNGYQGSDLVLLSYLTGDDWKEVTPAVWKSMLQ